MLNLQLNYERISQRKQLSGLLPGRLQLVGSSRYITARAVDVTSQGMGILSQDYLRAGDNLILTTSDHLVHLRVLYKKRDYLKSNRHRYGIVIADEHQAQEHDLITIFVDAGCLTLNP